MKQSLKVIFFTFWIGNLFCQSNTILVNEHFKNAPIAEVFETLKNKYGIALAYDLTAIEQIKITQNIDHLNLVDAIPILLKETGLEYQFSGSNRILIRKKTTNFKKENSLESFEISGRVIDAFTGESLSYANVFCEQLNLGVSADENGKFKIKVKTNKPSVRLSFQYLGYENKDFPVLLDRPPYRFVAGLKPQIQEFQEVTVLEKLPTLSTANYEGALTMRSASLDALPSFVGGKDLFRSLQLLPGISAHDDLSAGLIIRGSGSDENLVLLDGMTLYDVNHFFGIFSAINPNVIEKVNVYKNAFPIEFGARTSGVVEMESNEIKAPILKGGIELNLLTTNAWFQLPLSENMELMIGGRTTNQDLGETTLFDLANQDVDLPQGNPNSSLSRNQFITANPDFRFYDANAKWSWRPNANTLVKANFFRGFDEYQYQYEEQFTNRQGPNEVDNFEYFTENADWSNNGLSLQWQQQWSSKFQSEICVSATEHETQTVLTAGLYRDSPMFHDSLDLLSSQYNYIKQTDFNWKNQFQINDNQKLTFGYNYTHLKVEALIENEINRILRKNKKGFHQSLYLQYDHLLWDKTKISLGLRGTYFSRTEKMYYSPRIKLSHHASDNLKFKAAWSRNYQYLRQASHENRFGRELEFWVLGNKKAYPVANSNNYMIGFNFMHDFFEIDVEFFHKYTDEILQFALLSPGFDPNKPKPGKEMDYKIFKGNRTAKGVDILLKKHSGNYTGWLSYTLSKTTDKYKQVNRNQPFASEYDRRHQLNFVNQYRLGRWDLSATYIYASGKPYIDLTQLNQIDQADRENLNINDVQTRLKAYHRVDIGINYNFKIKGLKSNIGFSIFNLLNRNNVKYRQFVHSIPNTPGSGGGGGQQELNTVIGTDLELLGFTPNLTFGIKF